jgi:hypothetical protein
LEGGANVSEDKEAKVMPSVSSFDEAGSMITARTWGDFRQAGMLWLVNTILQVFGWSIVVIVDNDGTEIDAVPVRTRFRGFGDAEITKGHQNVAAYMVENATDLLRESQE